MTTREQKLWLHFLWSFSLSDHLGDAANAIRSFAAQLNLPIPGDYAELDTKSDDPEESWLAWLKQQGIEEGINSDEAKAVAEGV